LRPLPRRRDKPRADAMRILILNSARKFIGEAAHCLDLAKGLLGRGHSVVLVVREGSELEARAHDAGIPFQSLVFSSSFSLKTDWEDVRALRRLIASSGSDVVHVHRGKDHWTAAVATLAGAARAPLIRTRHMVTPMHTHLANRWLFRRASQVIAVSKAAAASFRSLRPLVEPKLSVIYSAVDQQRFSPDHRSDEWRRELGVPPGEALVGLVARYQNIKGQHVLISAASLILREFPGTRFLLAGRSNPYKQKYYLKLAAENGVSDNLILMDWLPDIGTAVASLDVGVLASLGSEGSSRVTYEYMASGVPVVATTVGCLPEIVRNEENGLLVPANDYRAMADAILQHLRNSDRARRMSNAALQRVRDFHNRDRWLDEILAVYEKAMASRGVARRRG